MKHYPITITEFGRIIRDLFPGTKAIEDKKDMANPGHLLWMLKRMQGFSSPAKRGRWVGHVNGVLVEKRLLNNNDSRNWIKQDVENGNE